jgi:hypothetical protein
VLDYLARYVFRIALTNIGLVYLRVPIWAPLRLR